MAKKEGVHCARAPCGGGRYLIAATSELALLAKGTMTRSFRETKELRLYFPTPSGGSEIALETLQTCEARCQRKMSGGEQTESDSLTSPPRQARVEWQLILLPAPSLESRYLVKGYLPRTKITQREIRGEKIPSQRYRKKRYTKKNSLACHQELR